MKTEKEKILAIIAEIQAEREAAHIVPPHVLTQPKSSTEDAISRIKPSTSYVQKAR